MAQRQRTRELTPAVRTALAVIVAVTLTVLAGPTVHAATATRMATITGSVIGVNDDPSHRLHGPLSGAKVSVIDAVSGKPLGTATTDARGGFRVGSVPATTVQVRITKAAFVGVWAGNAATRAGATTYELQAGQTLTITNQQVLNAEAVIDGQVLANFDPAAQASRVDVYDAVTHRRLASVYVAGGDSLYRIGGLPARPVKVRAVPLAGLWMPSWADGATSWATARTFSLHAGQHLSQSWEPVALYLDLGYASEISGTVKGGGRPIGQSTVTVLDPSGIVLATTRTDAAGRYSVRFSDWSGLQVKVKATKPGWTPAYANNQDSLETATLIDVPAQQQVPLAPLVLTR